MKLIGSTTTVTEVACSTTVATLAAVNESRVYTIIHNATGGDLYVKLGGLDAAEDDFSVIIADGAAYEVPSLFRGAISGIMAADSGNAYVTEIF
jgi:hypothetical protein